MSSTVLFVKDEEHILNSIERLFPDTDINIISTANITEAIDLVNKEQIAVTVSDNQTPEMKGIELLSRIKEISPDTLNILITSPQDLTAAVEAVNRGKVFRFIMEPWDYTTFVQTVCEAVTRYQTVQSMKNADETSLHAVAQTIELKAPHFQGHFDKVARYALMIAEGFNPSEKIRNFIRLGSIIHDCGKVVIPESILNKKGRLYDEEYEIIKQHTRVGRDLAKQAGLPEKISNIIHFHHERFDGSGYPSGLKGNDIPFEARIITVADVYDALTSERIYRDKYETEKALEIMNLMRGNVFDPDVLDMFLYRLKRNDQ